MRISITACVVAAAIPVLGAVALSHFQGSVQVAFSATDVRI